MAERQKILVLLSPVFNVHEQDNWLPWQTVFVRAINEQYPSLKLVMLSFHFPLAKEKKLDWNGNDVYLFGGGRNKLYTAIRWMRVWRRLQQLKRDYDVIGLFSFFCSESAFIGHYFAKRHGLQHKIWVLGQDARKENKQVARIRPEAAELICVSDFLQRAFATNHGVLPEHIIPIGIDPAGFFRQTGGRNIDILGAGSLIGLKQYGVFVEVVANLKKALPDICAVLCGEGEERNRLQQQISDAGLDKQVTLPGYIAHEQVLQQMHKAKVFLHTSVYEGLGMVCLEALYAGAHVVSFVKPLEKDIPNWHVVQDKEEMIRKVLLLLTDKNLSHEPVLAYDVHDAARAVVQLFGFGE